MTEFEHHFYKILCFRQYGNAFKMETYLNIAKLYLEDDDPVQADIYVNRASLLQKSEDTTEQHAINYKVIHHLYYELLSCILIAK